MKRYGDGRRRVEDAARMFDELCAPGDIMIDDKELLEGKSDALVGMWSQIISVTGQAERGRESHHDYVDALV